MENLPSLNSSNCARAVFELDGENIIFNIDIFFWRLTVLEYGF